MLYICTVHTRPSLPILKNTVVARLLTCLHLHTILKSKRSEFSVLKNFDIKANRTISPTSPMWSFRFGKPLSSCCASTISSVHCRLSKGWRSANKFSKSQIRNFVDLNFFICRPLANVAVCGFAICGSLFRASAADLLLNPTGRNSRKRNGDKTRRKTGTRGSRVRACCYHEPSLLPPPPNCLSASCLPCLWPWLSR
jgi:hypothetical protein